MSMSDEVQHIETAYNALRTLDYSVQQLALTWLSRRLADDEDKREELRING